MAGPWLGSRDTQVQKDCCLPEALHLHESKFRAQKHGRSHFLFLSLIIIFPIIKVIQALEEFLRFPRFSNCSLVSRLVPHSLHGCGHESAPAFNSLLTGLLGTRHSVQSSHHRTFGFIQLSEALIIYSLARCLGRASCMLSTLTHDTGDK